jgi:hypothetical protein
MANLNEKFLVCVDARREVNEMRLKLIGWDKALMDKLCKAKMNIGNPPLPLEPTKKRKDSPLNPDTWENISWPFVFRDANHKSGTDAEESKEVLDAPEERMGDGNVRVIYFVLNGHPQCIQILRDFSKHGIRASCMLEVFCCLTHAYLSDKHIRVCPNRVVQDFMDLHKEVFCPFESHSWQIHLGTGDAIDKCTPVDPTFVF